MLANFAMEFETYKMKCRLEKITPLGYQDWLEDKLFNIRAYRREDQAKLHECAESHKMLSEELAMTEHAKNEWKIATEEAREFIQQQNSLIAELRAKLAARTAERDAILTQTHMITSDVCDEDDALNAVTGIVAVVKDYRKLVPALVELVRSGSGEDSPEYEAAQALVSGDPLPFEQRPAPESDHAPAPICRECGGELMPSTVDGAWQHFVCPQHGEQAHRIGKTLENTDAPADLERDTTMRGGLDILHGTTFLDMIQVAFVDGYPHCTKCGNRMAACECENNRRAFEI